MITIDMRKAILLLPALMIWACTPAQQPENSGNDNPQGQTPDGSTPGGSTDDPGPGNDAPDFTPESWYTKTFWERSDRERMGLRGPVKKVTWGTPEWVKNYIMEFNEAGNLIYNKEVFYDTQRGYLYRYYYDEQNRLIRMEQSPGVPAADFDFTEEITPDPWSHFDPPIYYKYVKEFTYDNPGRNTLAEAYAFDMGIALQADPFDIRENYDVYHMIRPGLSSILSYESPNPMPEYWPEPRRHEFREETFEFDANGNLKYGIREYYKLLHLGTPDNPWNGEGAITGEWFEDEEEVQDYPQAFMDTFFYRDGYPYSYKNPNAAPYEVSEALWADYGAMTRYVNPGTGNAEFTCNGRYWHPAGWDKPDSWQDGHVAWEGDKYNYTYDATSGEPLKIIYTTGSWDRDFTYYDYTFDSHGNWLSYKLDFQYFLDGPESPYVTNEYSRTIEYF